MGDATRFNTTIEIREIEGTDRWSAILHGRAMPRSDMQVPEWGVELLNEITAYRGNPRRRSEAISQSYPPLLFAGEWKINRIRMGDLRVVFAPDQEVSSPQAICDAFVRFARRQKTVEVTWSGGTIVVACWRKFVFRPGRGPDRAWSMEFDVLGLDQPAVPDPIEFDPRGSLAALQTASRAIDQALIGYPPGLEPGFMEKIKNSFGNLRQSLASIRNQIKVIGDLARAPADALGEFTTLLQDARNTVSDAKDTWDDTAWEYQVQNQRSEAIGRAYGFKGSVMAPTLSALDTILGLLAFAEGKVAPVLRYVPVAEGASLVRIAEQQYGVGNGDLWPVIASANGLVSQTVPAGKTQLLIPRVDT